MTSIKLARPAEDIRAATVVRWLKQPGESFAEGDLLMELEAEEALILVQVTGEGTLTNPLVEPLQTVRVGTELARITTGEASPRVSSGDLPIKSTVHDSSEIGEVIPILMPQAGNTMEEGTVLTWLVKEGDPIELGQILCEIETDKATMEYESPAAGRMARIVAEANVPVAVKELIAVLADSDTAADAYLAEHQAGSSSGSISPSAVAAISPPGRATTVDQANGNRDSATEHAVVTGGRVKASPAARRISIEHGIALESLGVGSGPGGRILSTDVDRAAGQGASTLAAASTAGRRKPMSKMRRAIGLNLQQSKQTIPHFYMRVTIDAAPLYSFFQEQRATAICSVNDIVVFAVGRAMREFPAVRSQIADGEIVEFPHANIGIAVGVDDGLVVPVALNVDTLTLAQLAAETKRLVDNGRKGIVENIGRGNFTISNLGMFGVEEFSAIINPPESGILAVSAMREAVVVQDGALRPGRVMTMTLSADHRVVDGLLAAKFLARLKEILENPLQELV